MTLRMGGTGVWLELLLNHVCCAMAIGTHWWG